MSKQPKPLATFTAWSFPPYRQVYRHKKLAEFFAGFRSNDLIKVRVTLTLRKAAKKARRK